jgi:hypothetical protein
MAVLALEGDRNTKREDKVGSSRAGFFMFHLSCTVRRIATDTTNARRMRKDFDGRDWHKLAVHCGEPFRAEGLRPNKAHAHDCPVHGFAPKARLRRDVGKGLGVEDSQH